jgi:hypothetical protein
VNYFSEIEEPTIILLFGDHQPVAYSEFHNQQEKQLGEGIYQERYEVPFLIWANYVITEDDVDSISANYLSSYLLKTAGLKLTAYQKYLLQLRKEIPVINAHFYIDKITFVISSPNRLPIPKGFRSTEVWDIMQRWTRREN